MTTTTHKEAYVDTLDDIGRALYTRDSEALRRIARVYADADDMQQAHALFQTALKIEREDMAYDEARDEQLIDEMV